MKLDQVTAIFPERTNREEKMARTFAAVAQRLQGTQETHLGNPYNLSFGPVVPDALHGFLTNTSCAGSTYTAGVCPEDREAMGWLMRLWGCLDLDRYGGAFTASGTEANLWGLYLGRETLPDAVLLHSADAHRSVPGAARLLRVPAVLVASLPNGEMDMADFATRLRALAGRPALVALTCGTTMKGAHDNIEAALLALHDAGYDGQNRYVHVDGALNAMVLPFLQDVPAAIQPSFEKDIDSLSTCGHKMIGTPMPCGALVARREHIARVRQGGRDPHSNDAPLMASRNGHAVLALWARFFSHGYGRFAHDALHCVTRARQLADAVRALGAVVLHNPFSLTVVFPEPSEAIVRRYQLACDQGQAHVVVMPSVTDRVLAQFLADYAAWWGGRGRML